MSIIVGIPACSREVAGHPNHATPSRYGAAVIGGAAGMPVLLPPVGPEMGDGLLRVLDRLDGLLPVSYTHLDVYKRQPPIA